MYPSASCLNEIITLAVDISTVSTAAVSQFVARVTTPPRLWCPPLAVTRAAECDGGQHEDQWRVLAIVHSVETGE